MQLDEADRRILRHHLAEPALSRADLGERAGVTQDDIAKQFGVTVDIVRGACNTIKKYGVTMHSRALDALTDRFLTGGLISDEVNA